MNLQARLYDPVIGRFLSVDPLAEIQLGITPYHYCGNDPVNMSDASGLSPSGWESNDRSEFNNTMRSWQSWNSNMKSRGGNDEVFDPWDISLTFFVGADNCQLTYWGGFQTFAQYGAYNERQRKADRVEMVRNALRQAAATQYSLTHDGGVVVQINGTPVIAIKDGSRYWSTLSISDTDIPSDLLSSLYSGDAITIESSSTCLPDTPGDPEVGFGVEISGEFTYCAGANLSFIIMKFTQGADAGNWYYYFQPTATFGMNFGVSASVFWAFSSTPSKVNHTSPLGNHFNGSLGCGPLTFSTSFSYGDNYNFIEALIMGKANNFYTIGVGGGWGGGASFGIGETTGGIKIW